VSRLRVAIDVSAAVQQRAGIARYVRQLVDALLALENGPELIPYATRSGDGVGAWPAGSRIRQLAFGTRGWRALSLLSQSLGVPLPGWPPPCDVVHATDVVSPRAMRVPIVTTVHDLSFVVMPEHHTQLNRANLSWIAPRAVRHATRVIADSRATASEIHTHYGAGDDKVRVVYPGCDLARFRPQPAANAAPTLTRLAVRAPYVLFVGTWEPRKNLQLLLEAFAVLVAEGLPHTLLLVGGAGWKHEAAERRMHELGVEARVQRLGHVNDDNLPDLYRAASVFVYPSLYEGFGLPPLEAMACGVPVVTSDAASVREVVGDAALTVPARDAAALAAALRAVLSSEEVRNRLAAEGPRRAATFTWERTARETAAVYAEAVSAAR
jgi:glycosyltransferase involved in cell wall biosynthesis